MASTLSLVKRATTLARAGLAGLQVLDDDPTKLSNASGFVGYDDLVKAKGVLDLIVELPSFDEELGRYSASLNLCGSILSRSIQRRRRALTESTSPPSKPRQSRSAPSGISSQPSVSSETPSHHEYAAAGVAETPGPQASPYTTTPTSWELDDALTFDSIVGNPDAKRALFEHVVLPLKLSEAARSTLFGGIRSSGSNVLLHGPPGTGKTSIAKAASQEVGAAFFSVTPSSILSKYQGESERVLCNLFENAKASKPSIIFLDEVDALAPSRDGHDDVQSRRLLAELLLQTSQVRPTDRVIIVAATNRIDDVDVALLRRFHSRIFVGPPGHKERVDMIASFLSGIDHCLDEHHLTSLADRTSGWSGSDIKSLCREACMGPIRSLYEEGGDFERAVAQDTSGGAPIILRPVQLSDCDTAYRSLMGSSTSCDQAAAPVCDDALPQEATIGVEPQQCHEEYADMLTADDDGGEESAQRDSRTSATGGLPPEILLLEQQQ